MCRVLWPHAYPVSPELSWGLRSWEFGTVIPAKAGIQCAKSLALFSLPPHYGVWTPAFAGVTDVDFQLRNSYEPALPGLQRRCRPVLDTTDDSIGGGGDRDAETLSGAGRRPGAVRNRRCNDPSPSGVNQPVVRRAWLGVLPRTCEDPAAVAVATGQPYPPGPRLPIRMALFGIVT